MVTVSLQQQNMPVMVSRSGSGWLSELFVRGQDSGPLLQATAPLSQ